MQDSTKPFPPLPEANWWGQTFLKSWSWKATTVTTYAALPQDASDGRLTAPLLPNHSKEKTVPWWRAVFFWLKRNAVSILVIAVLVVVLGSLQYRSNIREQMYISQSQIFVPSDAFRKNERLLLMAYSIKKIEIIANSSLVLFQKSRFMNKSVKNGETKTLKQYKDGGIWDSWIGDRSLEKQWMDALDNIDSLSIWLKGMNAYDELLELSSFCKEVLYGQRDSILCFGSFLISFQRLRPDDLSMMQQKSLLESIDALVEKNMGDGKNCIGKRFISQLIELYCRQYKTLSYD
jgi:hypothetical protein